MSTNSKIAIENQNGEVEAIYCHWDGYPKWNGMILNTYYKELEKVKELISLGACSSINPLVNPTEGSGHSFSKPEEGVTVAYHRDRGEKFSKERYNDRSDFFDENRDFWCYVFTKEGKWHTMVREEERDLETYLKEISV